MSDIKDIKINVDKIQKRFGNKIKMPNEKCMLKEKLFKIMLKK